MWSDVELDFLRRIYPFAGSRGFMARFPKRSINAVRLKANRLGLGYDDFRWGSEELSVLKKIYSNHGALGFRKLFPSRSLGRIRRKASSIGLKFEDCLWRECEVNYLKRVYPVGGSALFLKRYPNRKPASVVAKARSMGLRYDSVYWSRDEDNFLKMVYAKGGVGAFLEQFPHRSQDAVYLRAKKFGLKCKNRFLVRRSPNVFELRLKYLLDKNFPSEWKFVGDGSFFVDKKCPDFLHVDGETVLLANGIYWHCNRLGFGSTVDVEKFESAHYLNHGLNVIFIWDFEMFDEEYVVRKVRKGFS